MVTDENFLDKEDLSILDHMKEFLMKEAPSKLPASKQLLLLIERAVSGFDQCCQGPSNPMQRTGELKKTFTPNLVSPPTSIMPKTNKKLKLLDVDALELARQLTILESHLYQKIRPMECLQRAREQKTDHNDNIAQVIQTSNRVCAWLSLFTKQLPMCVSSDCELGCRHCTEL